MITRAWNLIGVIVYIIIFIRGWVLSREINDMYLYTCKFYIFSWTIISTLCFLFYCLSYLSLIDLCSVFSLCLSSMFHVIISLFTYPSQLSYTSSGFVIFPLQFSLYSPSSMFVLSSPLFHYRYIPPFPFFLMSCFHFRYIFHLLILLYMPSSIFVTFSLISILLYSLSYFVIFSFFYFSYNFPLPFSLHSPSSVRYILPLPLLLYSLSLSLYILSYALVFMSSYSSFLSHSSLLLRISTTNKDQENGWIDKLG